MLVGDYSPDGVGTAYLVSVRQKDSERAALKLQGRYMGTMRGLSAAKRAKVKKIRASKWHQGDYRGGWRSSGRGGRRRMWIRYHGEPPEAVRAPGFSVRMMGVRSPVHDFASTGVRV